MTNGFLDLNAVRLKQAREMTNAAQELHKGGRSASALMLYVPALEMVGWEVNSRLDLTAVIQAHFKEQRGCWHRLRHFSAASVWFAGAMLSGPTKLCDDISFPRLSFKRAPKPGGSASDFVFNIDVEDGPLIMNNIAGLLMQTYQPAGLFDGNPRAKWMLNLKLATYFLGCAAMGFHDNKRMSLIHQDNAFDYTGYVPGEPVTGDRTFDLDHTCAEYVEAFSWIWHLAPRQEISDFLRLHLPEMLVSFAPVIRHNSYSRL